MDERRVSDILDRARNGGAPAADELVELVYAELRAIADRRMAGVPRGATLQPTALVHEAWLRLARRAALDEGSRTQLVHAASRAMRDLLVEGARAGDALKRGDARRRIELDQLERDPAAPAELGELHALDDALARLERAHPRCADVVRLRFFAGLTLAEVARELALSTSTVERRWELARAWLHRELTARGPQGCGE